MQEPTKVFLEVLKTCTPVLHDDLYVYARIAEDYQIDNLLYFAIIREDEGSTVIIKESHALEAGLEIVFKCARITLNVFSSLEGVGLTAAFSAVLTQHSISCNVIAAIHHDHIFVPLEYAKKALEALLAMQGDQLPNL